MVAVWLSFNTRLLDKLYLNTTYSSITQERESQGNIGHYQHICIIYTKNYEPHNKNFSPNSWAKGSSTIVTFDSHILQVSTKAKQMT